MTVEPSKPRKDRVVALMRIVFGGISVVYRYSSIKDAFNACEIVSNAMFARAEGRPTVPLIKGSVPLDRIRQDDDGNIVTETMNVITSTIRIDHISFVGVMCPCCGEQIFDKIRPFHPPSEHDEPIEEVDDDEPTPPKNPDDHGYFDGDAWKKGVKK